MNHSTSKIRKAFLAVGLLSGAAVTSIVFAAPASAADCTTFTTLAGLGLGTTCTTGGGWEFTLNSFTGFAGGDNISFTNGVPAAAPFTYGLSQQVGGTNWVPGITYSLGYTVKAPSPRLLSMFTSSLTSSVSGVPGGDAGTWDVTGSPGTAGAQFSTPSATNGQKFYSTPLASDTFTATLTVTNGQIQQVNSTINNQAPPDTTVPGPLPLLGAGAAFGFSRRIRSRIKAAA